MFGLKRVLVEWGFQRASVRVDTDAATVKVGGETAVTVSVIGSNLHCEWGETWRVWRELHESEELKSLLEKTARRGACLPTGLDTCSIVLNAAGHEHAMRQDNCPSPLGMWRGSRSLSL